MALPTFILGLSTPGIIVFGIVFFLWILGAIFNTKSTKHESLSPVSANAKELAEVRRRMLEQQASERPAVKTRSTGKAKRSKRAPPPLPIAARVATVSKPIARAAPAISRAAGEIGDPIETTSDRPQSVKNVRLLLQRNGITEAFIMAEILGKPRGLSEG